MLVVCQVSITPAIAMVLHTSKVVNYALRGPLAANLDEYAQPDERALPEGFHFNELFTVTPDPHDLTTYEGRNNTENPFTRSRTSSSASVFRIPNSESLK